MKIKFYGSPNQTVTVNMPTFYLNFDEKGEMLLSDDHPALDRMKNNFNHEEENSEPKLVCEKCGFETTNRGKLLAHYRIEHPKE